MKKKTCLTISLLTLTIAVVTSFGCTYAWYASGPVWNDVIIQTGDDKFETHIINKNFIKTYKENQGTITPEYGLTIGSDYNIRNYDETGNPLKNSGTSGAMFNVNFPNLSLDFIKDDLLLDPKNGTSLNYEHFWFGFSEFNFKQKDKTIFLSGSYQYSHNGGAAFDNLFKLRFLDDTNGADPTRKSSSSFFDINQIMSSDETNMDKMMKFPNNLDTTISNVGGTVVKHNFFDSYKGYSKDADPNQIKILPNSLLDNNIVDAGPNKTAYAYAFGVGICIDPFEFIKLFKSGTLPKIEKISISLSFEMTVSDREFIIENALVKNTISERSEDNE